MSQNKEPQGENSGPRPIKRVLVVCYSQTGQLASIVERIVAPLRADGTIEVHVETLRPVRDFPYPWPFFRFFDAFPESAHLVPPQLLPLGLSGDESFDLVILPYQVWFLAPSQPVVAFLKHPLAASLLGGKPVVTVVACRNMWMMAHTKMKALLADVGARHADNVVLTDNGPTLATLLTTPLWLLTGQRQYLRALPPAGVSEHDIARSVRFGRALRDALHEGRECRGQPMLGGLAAVSARPELMTSERAGTRSFYLWGKLLRLAGPPRAIARLPLLALYVLFLVAIIITVVPISLGLQALLRPLLASRLAAIKQSFEEPSGSGTERLALYDF